jgi:hypothetical protein
MNEPLIDKLLHKAGARFGAEGIDYSDFTSSKFAELIVRECVQVVNAADDSCEDYYGTIIKEHFGVKI